jgi:hypothetical protein
MEILGTNIGNLAYCSIKLNHSFWLFSLGKMSSANFFRKRAIEMPNTQIAIPQKREMSKMGKSSFDQFRYPLFLLSFLRFLLNKPFYAARYHQSAEQIFATHL